MRVVVHMATARLTVRQTAQLLGAVAITRDGLAVATGEVGADNVRQRLIRATDARLGQHWFEQLEQFGQSVLEGDVWPWFNTWYVGQFDPIIQALLRVSPVEDGPELVSVQQGSIGFVIADAIIKIEQGLRQYFTLIKSRFGESANLRDPSIIHGVMGEAHDYSPSQKVAAGVVAMATESMGQTLAQMRAREIELPPDYSELTP
jgi:hypothetical protein